VNRRAFLGGFAGGLLAAPRVTGAQPADRVYRLGIIAINPRSAPFIQAFEQRAADYVDRIFRGARSADLPIEQPTKYELVINLRSAQTLGLTIPPSVLLRADRVVE
jgi:hypothetical protein